MDISGNIAECVICGGNMKNGRKKTVGKFLNGSGLSYSFMLVLYCMLKILQTFYLYVYANFDLDL